MARLSIEQIRAPDLSVASQATARAGEAFQRATTSASDLLSKYQEGVEATGDAELTNVLASAKNEDEWNAILASTDFTNMNLSAGMRDQIINRRDNVLGYEQDRASRRGTDASTGLTVAQTGTANANTANVRNNTRINSNVDNRAGETFDRNIAVEDQRAGLAGDILRASEFGSTNGLAPENVSGLTGGPGANVGPRADGSGASVANPSQAVQANDNDVLMLARTLQAEAGNQGYDGMLDVGSVIANRTRDDRYGDGTINGVVMKRGQFSAWNGVTGYAGGEQAQDMSFQPNEQAMQAAQAIVSGNYEDRTNGATHYVNKSISQPSWGDQVTYKRGDHWFGQADGPGTGQTPQPQARQPVTQNPNRSTDANGRNDLIASASAEGNVLPYQEWQAIMTGQYDGAAAGQTAIDTADDANRQEFEAQQLLDASRGNVDPTVAVVEAQNNTRGATAVEELQRRNGIIDQAGEGGVFDAARLQIGTTGISPNDANNADATITDIEERQTRDPFQFAQSSAAGFSENPAESLRGAMDKLNISTVPSELEAAINTLASTAGVSRAEAAYSFARAAEDNSGFNANGIFTLGGDNLSQNKAEEFARKHFTGDQASTARETIADNQRIVNTIRAAASQLGDLERQIQKLRQQNDTVPPELLTRRTDAQNNLDELNREHRARRDSSSPVENSGDLVPTSTVNSLRQG